MHTTRLHVWFPMLMNGFKAELYYKKSNRVVEKAVKGKRHPGLSIDSPRTNRFSGLLEAAQGNRPGYVARVYGELLERLDTALEEATARGQG